MSRPAQLTLVSHRLCPYVQRAAIVLHEKGVAFERRWVDLADKPAWFLAMSPLGKTPVLVADGVPVFESAVICEYLDEVFDPRLHPGGPLDRARERAWIEFGSNVLATIAAFYNAPDEATLRARHADLRTRFAQLEAELGDAGPWFRGTAFGLVDAVFAPVFRYFDVFEQLGVEGFFDGLAKVPAWRAALARRPTVQAAAAPGYDASLVDFLQARGSALSRRIAGRQVAGSLASVK